MQTTKFLATVSLAGLFAGLMAVSANAQTALPTCNISCVGGPILAGHVSSAQEGLMEGVLVSLKREAQP